MSVNRTGHGRDHEYTHAANHTNLLGEVTHHGRPHPLDETWKEMWSGGELQYNYSNGKRITQRVPGFREILQSDLVKRLANNPKYQALKSQGYKLKVLNDGRVVMRHPPTKDAHGKLVMKGDEIELGKIEPKEYVKFMSEGNGRRRTEINPLIVEHVKEQLALVDTRELPSVQPDDLNGSQTWIPG